MTVVIAIDAGTTGVRAAAVARGRHRRGLRLPRVRAALPPAGLGGARRRRDLGGGAGHAGRAGRPPRRARRRHRDHRPARDGRGLGPAHRPSRCTGPSCGRTGAPPPAATSCGPPAASRLIRATTGLVLDPYFSATKLEWLLAEGGVADTPDLALGTVDSWVLWNLTGGTAGGVHATEPSNASRTMLFDIRTLAWSDELIDLFGVPRHALPEVLPSSGRFGLHRRRQRPARGHPGVGHRRRPAGGAVRPGLPRAGHDEEHLRHRQLRAHARGRHLPRAGRGPADDRGLDPRRRHPRLRARGRDLRHRRRRAVAPRRARDHRAGRGHGPLAASVARHGGRRAGARLHRARQPVVGSLRAGHGRSASPAGTTRAHIARAVLESMALQTRDVVERDERRVGPPDPGPQGRRRRVGQRPPAPAAGRPPRRARVPPGDPGDHRARRRLPGRPGRGGLGEHRRHHRQLAARRRVRTGSATSSCWPPARGLGPGRRAGSRGPRATRPDADDPAL